MVSPQISSNFLFQTPNLPRFTIECQCVDLKITNPMYTKRLVSTTCQLPDPPKKLFDACHVNLNVKILNFCSRLLLDSNKQTTIITPSSASYRCLKIIEPEYWVNPDVPHLEIMFDSGNYLEIICDIIFSF